MKDDLTCLFASKEYHLLYWMAQHKIDTSTGPLVKFSQIELAEECECSPATINKLLAALRKAKCVENEKRGSYRITETGDIVIAKMKEIEALVRGDENA